MEKHTLTPPELTDGVVVLRRMTEDDLPAVLESFELEPGLDEVMGFEDPPGEEKLRGWLPDRDTGVWMAITEPGVDRYLGDVAVHRIEWAHDRAELGFYTLLGERRRGYGTRAVALIRDWLFSDGFLRVQMCTLPNNHGVHGIARKAGFDREGLLRSYFVEKGRPTDVVMFSAISGEWTR